MCFLGTFLEKSRDLRVYFGKMLRFTSFLGTFLGKMRFFRHILYAHFQAIFLGSQAPKTFMQACYQIEVLVNNWQIKPPDWEHCNASENAFMHLKFIIYYNGINHQFLFSNKLKSKYLLLFRSQLNCRSRHFDSVKMGRRQCWRLIGRTVPLAVD